MDKLDNGIKDFDNTLKGWFSYADKNEYITAAIGLFLIVYASYAAPKLPPSILKLFENPLFKLLIFFLIVYIARLNATIAIIAAVALMVTIHALNKMQIEEKMTVLAYKQKENMDNLLEQFHQNTMMAMPEYPNYEMDLGEMAAKPNEYLSEESVAELQEERKQHPNDMGQTGVSCSRRNNFRNNFYPQYVNMKPDAYLSRYTGNEVNGFDPNAGYSSI